MTGKQQRKDVNYSLAVLLLLCIEASDSVSVITDHKGSIIYPKNVRKCIPVSGSKLFIKTWEFPVANGSALNLNFANLDIASCEDPTIVMRSGSKIIEMNYCGKRVNHNQYLFHTTTLYFESRSSHCLSKFSLDYLYIEHYVQLSPSSPVAVDEEITFSLQITALNISVNCSLSISNFDVVEFDVNRIATYAFALPILYNFTSTCSSPYWSGKLIKHGSVDVMTRLTKENIEMVVHSNKLEYMKAGNLILYHSYVYPIIYHLFIKKHKFVQQIESFKLLKFHTKSSQVVVFHVSAEVQSSLDPGAHNFTLVLYNEISLVRYVFPFLLTEPIQGFKIRTNKFVGISPSNFSILLTMETGTPADVSLSVRDFTGATELKNIKSHCSRNCHKIELSSTLPQGRYMINAYAYNDESGATASWSSFKAIPLVYDVFVMSPTSVFVNKGSLIYIFVKCDVGNYKMALSHKYYSRMFRLNVTSTNYNHGLEQNSLFALSHYHLVVDKLKFGKGGFNDLHLFLKNAMKSFLFSEKIFVRYPSSCLESAHIKDKKWINEPFLLIRNVSLEVLVKLKCSERVHITYEWNVFSVKSDHERPTKIFHLDTPIKQQELLLSFNSFLPGLYVIKVVATALEFETHRINDKLFDSILIKRPLQRVQVIIKGGTSKEIGIPGHIELSALLSSKDDSITYNWYCALEKDHLPLDAALERYSDYDSCLKSKEIWVSDKMECNLTAAELKHNEYYFIRLFISGNTILPSFGDQKIRILSHAAPKLEIRCLINCMEYASPNRLAAFELICKDCVQNSWTIENETYYVLRLDWCESKEICKINASILKSLNVNNIILKVMGINSVGNNAISTYDITMGIPPLNGTCSFKPLRGWAFITKFSVTCRQFKTSHLPLLYRFQFLDKELHNPIFQSGYSGILESFTLPASQNNIGTLSIEICDSLQVCDTLLVSTHLRFDEHTAKFYEFPLAIDNVLKSTNWEKITQTLSTFPETVHLNAAQTKTVIEEVKSVKLVTVDLSKKVTDVLFLVTRNISRVHHESKDIVWNKLMEINVFIREALILNNFDELVGSTVRACLATASQLMRSKHVTSSKSVEVSRIIDLGRSLMTSLAPEEHPLMFEESSVKASFLRMHRNAKAWDISSLDLPRFKSPVALGRVINEEVYRFNGSQIDFSTSLRKVDEVVAVSLTTGLDTVSSISPEEAEDLTMEFSVSRNRGIADVTLLLDVLSRNTSHHSSSSILAIIEIKVDEKENLKGAFFAMHFSLEEVYGRNITEVWILLSDMLLFNITWKLTGRTVSEMRDYDCLFPMDALPEEKKFYLLNVTFFLGTPNKQASPTLRLDVTTYVVICFFWDERIQDWNDNGCKPKSAGSRSKLKCECIHSPFALTKGRTNNPDVIPALFAARIVPYTDKVTQHEEANLWEKILRNPVMVVAMLVFFLFYLVLIFWAYRKEKTLSNMSEFLEVGDNSPFYSYRYSVTVYTGGRRSSGTTASVAIRLVGSIRSSDVHLIQTDKEVILKKNSVNTFLVTEEGHLGKITAVRLWHDNKGKSPEWFLHRMVVTDVERNECWFFICNSWFDHVIDHLFLAKKTKEVRAVYTSFWIKLENYLRSRHLFYSIFAMRPWQKYEMTRIERISTSYFHVCYVMVMCALHYEPESARNFYLLNPDYYSFQWSHVITGIQSALLCYPVTLMVSYFFRLCQDKASDKKENDLNDLERGALKQARKARRRRKDLNLHSFRDELQRDIEKYEEATKDRKISLLDIGDMQSQFTICKEHKARFSYVKLPVIREDKEIAQSSKKSLSPSDSKKEDMSSSSSSSIFDSDENEEEVGQKKEAQNEDEINQKREDQNEEEIKPKREDQNEDEVKQGELPQEEIKQREIPKEETTQKNEALEKDRPVKSHESSTVMITASSTNAAYSTATIGDVESSSKTSTTLSHATSKHSKHSQGSHESFEEEEASDEDEDTDEDEDSEEEEDDQEDYDGDHDDDDDDDEGGGKSVTYTVRPGNYDVPELSMGPHKLYENVQRRNKSSRRSLTILKPRNSQNNTTLTIQRESTKEVNPQSPQATFSDISKNANPFNLFFKDITNDKGNVLIAKSLKGKASTSPSDYKEARDPKGILSFSEDKLTSRATLVEEESTYKKSLRSACLSNSRNSTQTVKLLSYKRSYRPWPWYCFYVGWAIIVGGSICSMWFSLVIGMQKGLLVCQKWLMSVVSAILASIIVLETLHATFLSFIYVICKRRIHLSDWLPRIIDPITPTRRGNPESVHLRQVVQRADNPAYRPRDLDEVENEEIEKSAERKTRRNVKNMSIHVLNLVFLLVATMGQRDENFFYFRQTLNDMIVSSAEQISTRAGIYDWIEFSLADALTSGHVSHFKDGQLLVLSQPRIRQKRVMKGTTCRHTEAVVELQLADSSECKENLDIWTEDKRHYDSGWHRLRATPQRYEPVQRTPWTYETEDISWLVNYYGEHGVYNGEGYYATMPNDSVGAHVLASSLRQSNWIDDYTRIVVLEAVFYNVPTRTFCVLTVGIETLNLGTVSVTSNMMFMRSHHIAFAWDIVVYIALYSILLMVFYHMFEVSSQLREKGCRFLYNVWNILHTLTLVLSVASVALYLTRASYMDLALLAHSHRRPSYHLFHTSCNLDYATRCLLSVCAFLTMAYTIRIMQGHPVFNLLYGTFHRARHDLVGHSFYLVFLYCTFCHVGILLFKETRDFSSIIRTMQVVLGFSMEAFSSSEILSKYPLIGFTYLMVFVVVFTKCFVNFYVVILENSFRETKLLRREITGQENIVTFGRKQLRSLFVIREEKMKDKTNQQKQGYLKMLKKAKKQ